jgi:hypothetical protein
MKDEPAHIIFTRSFGIGDSLFAGDPWSWGSRLYYECEACCSDALFVYQSAVNHASTPELCR